MPEPLSFTKLGDHGGPKFIRKITRRRHWEDALTQEDPSVGGGVFEDEQELTSVWRVTNDVEFRRAALAMNEGRGSLHEELFLLPILPEELAALGFQLIQSAGITDCQVAAGLHYEIPLIPAQRMALAAGLIQAGRSSIRCKKNEMRIAEELSSEEGCLSVYPGPHECIACGAVRE